MKFSWFLIAVSLILCSCSRKSDSSLYQEGKAAEDQKDYRLAVERYEEIVNRFPQSAYAESALYHEAVVENNDLHDIPRAVQAYQKFYALFPNSKLAPTALFLSAFLLNNELHLIDSAKLAYQTFLQKYPSHDLAPSARFELETLGKDVPPFLNKEMTTDEAKSSHRPKKGSSQ